jgi:hypothetical protein
MTELLESFFGDWGRWEVFAEEDVIPYFVGHFFGGDVCGTEFRAVDFGVEEMSDCVVCHIDCGIRERFDEILWVPGDF